MKIAIYKNKDIRKLEEEVNGALEILKQSGYMDTDIQVQYNVLNGGLNSHEYTVMVKYDNTALAYRANSNPDYLNDYLEIVKKHGDIMPDLGKREKEQEDENE